MANRIGIRVFQDATLRVMAAFTKPDGVDEFVDGLTSEQYSALRALNVLRIDSGDDRIPEDHADDRED